MLEGRPKSTHELSFYLLFYVCIYVGCADVLHTLTGDAICGPSPDQRRGLHIGGGAMKTHALTYVVVWRLGIQQRSNIGVCNQYRGGYHWWFNVHHAHRPSGVY